MPLAETADINQNSNRPKLDTTLPKGVRFSFAFGQAAEGIKNESFGIFLLFFYTNIMGLSGTLAGQAILISLLFDAVTDPFIGALSDRTRGKWGRRHPYMYASAIPLGITFFLVFAPPDDLSQHQLFLWMLVSIVLCRAAMTLFHVPHLSLGAELSSDYQIRTKIVTERMAFQRVGAAFAGIVGFVWYLKPTEKYADGRFNPDAYPEFALLFAVTMAAIIFVTSHFTRSQIPYLVNQCDDVKDESLIRAMFLGTWEALKIPSFRALFTGQVIAFIAWGVAGTLGLHMATFFWHITNNELIIWGICAGAAVFVGLGFWSQAASKISKKTIFIVGLSGYLLFIAPPFIFRAIGFWPHEDSIFYLPMMIITTGMVAPFFIAATMVTGGSMMADITDEDELNCGKRREGIFFGASSFAAKASVGVGGLIAGLITDFAGVANLKSAEEAGADAIYLLGMSQGLIMLFLIGLAIIFFSQYNLSKERLKEIQKELSALRA